MLDAKPANEKPPRVKETPKRTLEDLPKTPNIVTLINSELDERPLKAQQTTEKVTQVRTIF